MSNPMIIVVGAGPGVGASVARRFGRDGHRIGLIGTGQSLEEVGTRLRDEGLTVDWLGAHVADAAALHDAVEQLARRAGRVDVLHYNPSTYRASDPLQLTVPELLEDVALGVGGLLTAVQAARATMRPGSRVTATGSIAADRPSPEAASLGVQKAGLRNLVQSLDRVLAPDGIRAVTVTVEGALAPNNPESPFHPDQAAEAVHAAARQHDHEWSTEVRHPGG